MLYGTGNYNEAIAYFDKALEVDTKNFRGNNGKANAIKDLVRYEEALQFLDKAKKVNQIIQVYIITKEMCSGIWER